MIAQVISCGSNQVNALFSEIVSDGMNTFKLSLQKCLIRCREHFWTTQRMKIVLDPLKGISLTEQIARQLEEMIRSRQVHIGAKLPSIRQLATAHQISRFPIIEAYDLLVSKGLIQPKHGSGFYVSGCADAPNHLRGADPRVAQAESSNVLRQFSPDGDAPPLSSGFIPTAWRDLEGIAQAVRQISRTDTASLVDYAVPQGDATLREQISRRLHLLEIETPPQHILITHSASQALDLVARTILRPGDTVFVEDPGYFNLFGLLKLQGIRLVGVPRLRTGPDVSVMEDLLTVHRPKLFLSIRYFRIPRRPISHRKLHSGCCSLHSYTTFRSSKTTSMRICRPCPRNGLPRWINWIVSFMSVGSPRPCRHPSDSVTLQRIPIWFAISWRSKCSPVWEEPNLLKASSQPCWSAGFIEST